MHEVRSECTVSERVIYRIILQCDCYGRNFNSYMNPGVMSEGSWRLWGRRKSSWRYNLKANTVRAVIPKWRCILTRFIHTMCSCRFWLINRVVATYCFTPYGSSFQRDHQCDLPTQWRYQDAPEHCPPVAGKRPIPPRRVGRRNARKDVLKHDYSQSCDALPEVPVDDMVEPLAAPANTPVDVISSQSSIATRASLDATRSTSDTSSFAPTDDSSSVSQSSQQDLP